MSQFLTISYNTDVFETKGRVSDKSDKALCIPIVGTTENKDQLALLNYPTNISGVDAVDSVSGGEECGIDRVIL